MSSLRRVSFTIESRPTAPLLLLPPSRREDVKSHIDAIIDALEEEQPPMTHALLVTPRPSSCTGARLTTEKCTTDVCVGPFSSHLSRCPWSRLR